MRKIITLFSIAVFVCSLNNVSAQGCSDAGVCTIHAIKNNTEGESTDKTKNEVTVGFSFGKGERKTNDYTTSVEYTRSLGIQTSVTGKLSFSAVGGELANTSGLSDLFLSVNHAFDIKKKWQKSFIVGLKIPLDDGNIIKNGIYLPMPYQTSLGTTDLVLGLNFLKKSFGATIAVQQPLKPANGNRFLPQNYPLNKLASEYLPTNKFVRKGDVLLRFSYNIKLNNKKFSVRPSLLSIYHEANDTYLDASDVRREIPKSNGLTLNAVVFAGYKLNAKSGFELGIGSPFVVRTNRPDGLTRSVVASLDYKINF
ncbi:hypothetical protein [Ferruginibacter sp. SUN106]|uniref:hypothetical protein n=1 Tax=Ferruginibacter sp. SUN106 TaxID=2978348 RepID=UPI003D361495